MESPDGSVFEEIWECPQQGSHIGQILQGRHTDTQCLVWSNTKVGFIKKIMLCLESIQECESSDLNLISDFFALHKTPFSDFQCIEKHIFSGISDYFRLFRLFLTDALTPLSIISVESQKGTITIQRCSVDNQKGAITRLCTAIAPFWFSTNIFKYL